MNANFFWGSNEGKKKMHLLNKKAVWAPIEESGLAIKKMDEFNIALLGKQLWRMMKREDLLANKWINNK